MTDREILLALYEDMQKMKSDVQNTKDELKNTKEELKAEIQNVRNEIQSVRQELKAEIQDVRAELKAEIQDVRAELKAEIQDVRAELKAEIQDLRDDLEVVYQKVIETGMTIENVTNHNIQLLAENHINLVDKLNDAIRVQDKSLLYEVQVSGLKTKVDRLEIEVAELKSKIA